MRMPEEMRRVAFACTRFLPRRRKRVREGRQRRRSRRRRRAASRSRLLACSLRTTDRLSPNRVRRCRCQVWCLVRVLRGLVCGMCSCCQHANLRKNTSLTSCTGMASQIPLERAWMIRHAIKAPNVVHWLQPMREAR